MLGGLCALRHSILSGTGALQSDSAASGQILRVKSRMLVNVEDDEVVRSIIGLVVVQMMNMFIVTKRSAKRLLHHPSVFPDELIGGAGFTDDDVAVVHVASSPTAHIAPIVAGKKAVGDPLHNSCWFAAAA